MPSVSGGRTARRSAENGRRAGQWHKDRFRVGATPADGEACLGITVDVIRRATRGYQHALTRGRRQQPPKGEQQDNASKSDHDRRRI